MTKVTVFNENISQTGEKIELVKFVVSQNKLLKASKSPSEYDYICLLGKLYHELDMDIIMAWYDDNPNNKMIYLGHWNGGVV